MGFWVLLAGLSPVTLTRRPWRFSFPTFHFLSGLEFVVWHTGSWEHIGRDLIEGVVMLL